MISWKLGNYISLDQISRENWLKGVCRSESKELGEVGIHLVSDDELIEMNREYLSHDYYTDIITFDYGYNQLVTGELWVSFDRVRENAKEQGQLVSEELDRVIVHGVLHLIGYTDGTDKAKQIMRSMENRYLKQLN